MVEPSAQPATVRPGQENSAPQETGHKRGNNVEDKIPPKLLASIFAVGSLAFIGILTETCMTVLFPELMGQFHVSMSTVQWITTIYLLVVGATMPISSYLKRRFTLKSLFVTAIVLAVVGSAIMVVGQQFWLLLVARVIQGVGSGIATPLMFNIILEQAPQSKIGRLMGVGSMVINVAPAIGPTVGGAVHSVMSWRWIFVAVIPLVLLISLPIGLKCIEQKRDTEDAQLNPLQFISIVLSLITLVFALNQLGVAVSDGVNGTSSVMAVVLTILAFAIGLASMVLFVWSSKHSFSPLIRLGFMRERIVVLHLLAYTMIPMVTIGFGYVITNLAQLSMHQTAFVAGMLVLPGALIAAFLSPVGGMFYDKYGARKPILVSMLVEMVGVVLLVVFSMHLDPWMVAFFYFIFCVGNQLSFSNIMTSAISEVEPEFAPDVNAVFNTALQFGGAAGTTLFSTLIAVSMAGTGAQLTQASEQAARNGGFWCFLAMFIIVLLAFGCLVRAFALRARKKAL